MPVASSSRRGRRLRREPSDVIEEDGPSQVQAALTEDIVEEDEEQEEHPRQVAVRGNGTRRVQREAEVEEQAEEDNELDLNPLADFGEQPLDKAQATRIGGIASDWNSIRTQIHGNSYALVRDVAASIAEFTDGEKGDKALLGIEDMMKGLVDTEHELLVHEETLNELHQKVARGESIIYITSLYEETVQRRIAEYRKKTTRQKYVKNDEYASFKQAIFEVQHPDTAMPPVSDFIPKEDGDDSDEDEDIQVGGVMQDYKCPLSLTILVDPLTS
ncbi:hypothetical protein EW026_g1173 [Hermanssonia centrifuga]|uniref:Uncharacterized protein n=1 Tax=Hermanssonia centrifuga TaxID=98765 RepID=A0A4S4KTA0_9APHY|nr:hypothetical protein EW026_g1173 [Hermanssonia centrifuga]